ncbi:MAG: prepilin peptidase [Planctomycetaceae bacterium]
MRAPILVARGIGGGDLKLVTALGAWLGPAGTLSLLFWTALAGAVSAVVTAIRQQRDFPFGPAILAGLIVTCLQPELLSRLIEGLRIGIGLP